MAQNSSSRCATVPQYFNIDNLLKLLMQKAKGLGTKHIFHIFYVTNMYFNSRMFHNIPEIHIQGQLITKEVSDKRGEKLNEHTTYNHTN